MRLTDEPDIMTIIRYMYNVQPIARFFQPEICDRPIMHRVLCNLAVQTISKRGSESAAHMFAAPALLSIYPDARSFKSIATRWKRSFGSIWSQFCGRVFSVVDPGRSSHALTYRWSPSMPFGVNIVRPCFVICVTTMFAADPIAAAGRVLQHFGGTLSRQSKSGCA